MTIHHQHHDRVLEIRLARERVLNAQQAHGIGLVTRVVDDEKLVRGDADDAADCRLSNYRNQ